MPIEPDELLINGLELLKVDANSFVMLKVPIGISQELIERIGASVQAYAQRHELDGVTVCALPTGVELSVISEESMDARGWKRKPTIHLAEGVVDASVLFKRNGH